MPSERQREPHHEGRDGVARGAPRAIKRQLVLLYGLALMLGAIVFLIWRVNELAHAVDQMQFGR